MRNTGTEYVNTERTPKTLSAFSGLLPPLTDEQLSLLEADILQNGCYAPVIVNEDMVIVDGHNRYAICEKHGLPYRMAVFSFTDDLEAKEWALATQKSRRNLSVTELCKIALKLRPEVEARAKKKQQEYHGNQYEAGHSATLPNVQNEAVDTRKELAQAVGVGERTMVKAMKIEDGAPQPVKDAIDDGTITIHQGYNITKELEDVPKEEQEQAAMEAVEREIARKQENRKRRIDEKTRIAKIFCSAFEHSVLLEPTAENVQLWVEQSGILPDQMDSIAKEARRISEVYQQIAEAIANIRNQREGREEHGQDTEKSENGNPDDFEEAL